MFMPRKDGLETIRDIRRLAPEGIKVIAMSGGGGYNGMVDMLPKAGKLGVNAVLYKPFGPDQMLKTVGELLGIAAVSSAA